MSKFLRDERGATAIEYSLIASLIFLAIITGVTSFGTKTTGVWAKIGAALDAVL